MKNFNWKDFYTAEELEILKEEDRLYLKSLKTKLTKEEEEIMSGENWKSNKPRPPNYL
jgi:hypothetical protein